MTFQLKWFFSVLFLFATALGAEEIDLQRVSSSVIDVSKHDENVKHNLRLALKKIESIKLSPGFLFSFNQIIGEGSAENGYRAASVYFGGESVSEPGGGLCILATALYNLFLQVNFSIVQRAKHSKPVSYIAGGLDATISYSKTDLKMKNTGSQTYILRGRLDAKRLYLELYTEQIPEFEYEPRVESREEIHAQEEIEVYRTGRMVDVYLDKKKDGVVLESKLLYTEYLRPFFRNPPRKTIP